MHSLQQYILENIFLIDMFSFKTCVENNDIENTIE